MAVWIYRGLPCWISIVSIYYAPELDIQVKSNDHFNFSIAFVVQFRAPRYIMGLRHTPGSKVVAIRICRELWCLISSVSIYYAPESDICDKSYDYLNFSRASVVHFQASWYIMAQIWTSVWKVMTIRISRDLPLFNFECFDILCPRIEHPCEKLWPFEFLEYFHCEKLWPFKFLESFRCLISSVSIYYVRNSNIRVKSYDHSNFSRTSVV